MIPGHFPGMQKIKLEVTLETLAFPRVQRRRATFFFVMPQKKTLSRWFYGGFMVFLPISISHASYVTYNRFSGIDPSTFAKKLKDHM